MGKLPTQTYNSIAADQTPTEYLRNKLKLKHLQSKNSFINKYPDAHKFLLEKGVDLAKVREHSAKVLSAGALTGALLLNTPQHAMSIPNPHEIIANIQSRDAGEKLVYETPQEGLVDAMKTMLPEKPRPLTRQEEKNLERVFEEVIKIPARATLEGEHLNTTYGLIGAEQHLKRYPGDTNEQHGSGIVLKEGIAPGLGGFGYFAPSKDRMTPDLVEKEKWYAVVQTLYLPDWNTRTRYLVNWYKYRKVLIVNTENGRAVVADIADAGPAAWTGKSFGGSPEVMLHLGGPRYKKGPVVLFFVDDPDNKVPLGPVEYSSVNKLQLVSVEI